MRTIHCAEMQIDLVASFGHVQLGLTLDPLDVPGHHGMNFMAREWLNGNAAAQNADS